MAYSVAFQMKATMIKPQSEPDPNATPVKNASVYMMLSPFV